MNKFFHVLYLAIFLICNPVTAQYSIEQPSNFSSSFSLYDFESILACNVTVDAGNDIVVCEEDLPVQLNGSFTGNAINFSWTPIADLDDPNSLTPMASAAGTYTLTVESIEDINLVSNGDFELGDTGFTSGYSTGIANVGNYLITDNPQNYFGLFSDCDDHTSGSGNMMIVDGAVVADQDVWCQVVTVNPNTNYYFSLWATMVGGTNPPDLFFSVDGIMIGGTSSIPLINCEWNEISQIWNSQSNTTIEVCIGNTNISSFGNDFALDDILISPICVTTDDVVVSILEANAVALDVIIPCEGDCITLDGTSSTQGSGVTYDWTSSTGGNIQDGNTLTPTICETGTYQLEVTNTNSGVTCIDTITITATLGLANPIVPILDGATTVCEGQIIAYSITSNDPNTSTYQWTVTGGTISTGQGSSTIDVDWTGSTSGEVCVYAENNCGQSAPACTNIVINEAPDVPSIIGAANICSNPIATYEITPALNISTYQWTLPTGVTMQSGQGSFMITVDWGTVQGGDICIEVSNSCGSESVCLTVTFGNIQADIDSQNPNCEGDNNGSITITPSGGTIPYTYAWEGGETDNPLTGLSAGTYTVTVSDDDGCTTEEIITLVDPSLLTLSLDSTLISCNGACDGTITATVGGGTTPYTYAWSNSAGDVDNISNLCGGTYTVMVTDMNGCTIEDQVTLTEPIAFTATIGSPSTICLGDAASLIFTADGVGTFDIELSDGSIFTGVADGDMISVSPTATTTITITNVVDQGGCLGSSTSSILITVNTPPNEPIVTGDEMICEGSLVTYCMTNIADVSSFNWTVPADASFTGQSTDCIEIDWTGSLGGQICIDATNDCGTTTKCIDIIVNPIPTSNFTVDQLICIDSTSTVTYTGSANSSATYTWDFGGGSIVSGSGVGPYEIQWSTSDNQTVTLTVEENGCTSTTSFETIDVDEPLDEPNITCNSTTTSIVFTWADVPGATSYMVNDLSGTGGMAIANMYTVTGLTNGQSVTIEVIASGNNVCGTSVATLTCEADNCPSIPIEIEHIDPICLSPNTLPFDFMITITGSDNTGIGTWSGNGITDVDLGTFDPNIAGLGVHDITYTFIENSCTYTDVVTVEIFEIPTSTFTVDDTICINETSTITYTGSATPSAIYTWDFETGTIISGNGVGPYEIEWTTSGTYNITLTVEENGCPSDMSTQTVVVDAPLDAPDVTCTSTTQSVIFSWGNVTGATSYIVNDISGPAGTLVGNTYEVIGLNTNQSVTIEVIAVGASACGNSSIEATCQSNNCPPVSVEIASVDSICLENTLSAFDLTATITGGNNTGTSTWSGNGITDASLGTFDPVVAGVGNHNITFTYNQDSCDFIDILVIEIFEIPTSTFMVNDTICVNATSTITYTGSATPSANYTWDFGTGTIISGSGVGPYEIEWANSGTYNITLTVEENGCTSDVSTEVVQVDAILDQPSISCSSTTNSVTFSWANITGADNYQVVELMGTGGVQNGNTYTFSNLNTGESVSIEVIASGSSVCGTSVNSVLCSADLCPTIDLQITPIANICLEPTTPIISLEVIINGSDNSGTGSWSGVGVVNNDFDPNLAGEGMHTVYYSFDEQQCNFIDSIVIEIYLQPIAIAGDNQHLDCATTMINLDGNNSSSFGLPTWTTNTGNIITGTNTLNPEINAPGTYYLSIENSGCSAEDSLVVTQNIVAPIADAGTQQLITCNIGCVILGGNNTSVGTNFTYEWTGPNGFTSNEITPEICIQGEYILTVFDIENSCSSLPSSVMVMENTTPPNAIIEPFGNLDCTTTAILLDGSTSSTGADFSYQWSNDAGQIPGAQDAVYEVTEEGTYTLQVTNTFTGCISYDTATVNDLVAYPFVEIASPEVLTCIDLSVELDGSASSISPTLVYSWSGPAGGIQSGGDTNIATVTLPGQYELTILDMINGCETTESINVLQNIVPPSADAGLDVELGCNQTTVMLGSENTSSGNNFTYLWTSDNPNAIILDPTMINTMAEGLGTYTLTVLNIENGCTTSDQVVISQSANVPNNINLEFMESLCHGDDNGMISIISVDGGISPYTYSINGSAFSSNSLYNNLPPGDYEVTIQDAFGCLLSTTITLTEPDPLTIDLGDNITIELGDSMMLEPQTTGVYDTIYWQSTTSFSSCELDPFCLNPIVTPTDVTNITATVIDENGCFAQDQLVIFVAKERFVYIPNAFSPNGNPDNQIFTIYGGKDVKQINEFKVFGRWGEALFEAKDFQPNDSSYGWDGRFKGKEMNPGVFVYFAEIEFIDGRVLIYKGDVTLMK